MDSINQQQQEENRENLQGADAIKRIKDMAEAASTCFFCTHIHTGEPFSTRPMAVLQVDDEGNLWFMSANDSKKNMELQDDIVVQLLFQGSTHTEFLNLYGTASISADKEKIKELWNPMVKTWFTEGQDDPRISVIKVQPEKGYYWDTKHGKIVALLKIAAGAIMGKTLDDSIEGKLRP